MKDRKVQFAEPLQQFDRTYVQWRGRRLTYFGGCDYFRLSTHPQVVDAVHEGVERFGLNVAASRFTTGNHELYGELETKLRQFFRTETATLLSNGYATNIVMAQALAGEFSHALIDSRAHQSLRDCAAFLKCTVREFAHADTAALSAVIRRCGRKARILLLTDGLFSHNGTLAPLREYLEILPRGSRILLDDAHGAGTVGAHGRGTMDALEIASHNIIQTISLSKAFGVYGGAVLGTKSLREKILQRSNLAKGNTPLPLPLAWAAIRAVELLRSDKSLRTRLELNAAYIHSALSDADISQEEKKIPIVAMHPAQPATLRQRLLREGILPTEIRYQDRKPYFRFTISSEHSHAQLDALIRACRSD